VTREEFAPIVAYLSALVGKPMGREQAEVYYDLLADLPEPLARAAVRRAACACCLSVIPAVGEIRAAAAALAAPASLGWPEAWRLACQAAARWGLYRAEAGLASLPVGPVRRAVLAVGWQALCDADPASLDTLRAQFRDAYGVLGEREERERLLPPGLRAEAVRLLAEQIGALPGDAPPPRLPEAKGG